MQTQSAKRAVGFFGGTFDPVHFGHLRSAIECAQAFSLDEVRMMPCQPGHKNTLVASVAQRKAMMELAIQDSHILSLECFELDQQQCSYTVNTLQYFRTLLADDTAIYFIVGVDAFNAIESWLSWRDIFSLANIIVLSRPSTLLSINNDEIKQRLKTFTGLHAKAGCIYQMQVSALDISSTHIRQMLASKQSADFLLPTSVISYIQQQGLYQ